MYGPWSTWFSWTARRMDAAKAACEAAKRQILSDSATSLCPSNFRFTIGPNHPSRQVATRLQHHSSLGATALIEAAGGLMCTREATRMTPKEPCKIFELMLCFLFWCGRVVGSSLALPRHIKYSRQGIDDLGITRQNYQHEILSAQMSPLSPCLCTEFPATLLVED